MKRFKRWSLGTWERKLRGLDGYERLPGEEHVTAADVGVTNVFGVGSECRVFLSERAVYLLSTVPKAKGVPQFGTDMMATRVSFESVRHCEAHAGERLLVAYDSAMSSASTRGIAARL
jgi:hypothetical protein